MNASPFWQPLVGLVTLFVAVHDMYMREYWVHVHESPIVYRYVDWTTTTPLQMSDFNLIFNAARKSASASMLWRLLLGIVAMLACAYAGETVVLVAWTGFIVGMYGWCFILKDTLMGRTGGVAGECSPTVNRAVINTRFIMTKKGKSNWEGYE